MAEVRAVGDSVPGVGAWAQVDAGHGSFGGRRDNEGESLSKWVDLQ